MPKHITEKNKNTKVWRYMDLAELLGLLQLRQLHFSRVDMFEDVFEGKFPEIFFQNWSDEAKTFYNKRHEEGKGATFVNCWSIGNNESYAMWKIYAGKYDGVAIYTTVDRLRKGFEPSGYKIDIRKISYIDYSKMVNGVFDFTEKQKAMLKKNFYACKSIQYEYEKEIRVIVSYGEEDVKYLSTAVDLDAMIEGVYINPFAGEWYVDLIRTVMDHHGLHSKPVRHSNIEVRKK